MRLGFILLCVLAIPSAVLADPATCYDWIARERIRGGFMSGGDPTLAPARMKAVGMNLLMPSFSGLQYHPTEDNIKLLWKWGQAAKANGLHLMPVFNFRGSENERIFTKRRYVGVDSVTMKKTPCPADEAFWQWYIEGRFVWLAEHAKALGLDGAILDPEMYGADRPSYAGVCYCDDCFSEFSAAGGKQLPAGTPPSQRAAWLKANGLEAAFEQHLEGRVKGFCQRIESKVHAKNPAFLIGTLQPDIGGPFTRGLVMGLGAEQYPLVGFTESTYNDGYTDYVEKQQLEFAKMPAHVLFVVGIWHARFPTENLSEQYYNCAAHSRGYWVYSCESLLRNMSRFPDYKLPEPNGKYWDAMSAANAELDKLQRDSKYVSSLKVRPFEPPMPPLRTADIPIQALIPSPDKKPLSLGAITQPRLRYRNPLAILCKAGEPLRFRITNFQFGQYKPGTQWELLGPDGKRVLEGRMKVRESSEGSYTPTQGGVHLLVVESDINAHFIDVRTGQPNAYMASARHQLTVHGILGRMYFYVPKGVAKFTFFVKVEGEARQGAKLTVYGPDGKAAAHIEGDLGTETEMPVVVPIQGQGRVWCLSGEDIYNQLHVYVSPNVPGYLSTEATKVLTRGDEKLPKRQ